MGILSDVLGMAGSAISAPGDYTRGALAGKFGERMGGRDLLRHYGVAGQDDNWGNFLGGMATDVLTDPLTYAGAFMGAGGAGSLFGNLGPRLGANAAKLAGIVPESQLARGGASLADEVLRSPVAKQVLHEIPQGSKFLGAGAESLNLATPEGDVLKLLRHNPKAAIGVPEVEGVIQPTRRVVHGGFEVNRVPLAQNVGDPAVYRQAKEMVPGLNNRGVDVFDLKPEDVGLVGGRPTILDMGSVDQLAPRPFRQIVGRTPASWRAAGMAGGGSASPLLRAIFGGGGDQ